MAKTSSKCPNSPAKDLQDLTERIYPDINRHAGDAEWLQNRAILTPLNADVDRINAILMGKIVSEQHLYNSVDRMADPEAVPVPVEVLNGIEVSGLPSHQIVLKIGVPVVIMRNLDAPRIVNGTLCTVVSTRPNVIELAVLTGPGKGDRLLLPRIWMEVAADSGLGFSFRRLQFPLKVAFGMTVNRCQGQTKRCVGVYLPQSVFTHGQLYVALSRVGSADGIEVFCPKPYTRNVVYREVL